MNAGSGTPQSRHAGRKLCRPRWGSCSGFCRFARGQKFPLKQEMLSGSRTVLLWICKTLMCQRKQPLSSRMSRRLGSKNALAGSAVEIVQPPASSTSPVVLAAVDRGGPCQIGVFHLNGTEWHYLPTTVEDGSVVHSQLLHFCGVGGRNFRTGEPSVVFR